MNLKYNFKLGSPKLSDITDKKGVIQDLLDDPTYIPSDWEIEHLYEIDLLTLHLQSDSEKHLISGIRTHNQKLIQQMIERKLYAENTYYRSAKHKLRKIEQLQINLTHLAALPDDIAEVLIQTELKLSRLQIPYTNKNKNVLFRVLAKLTSNLKNKISDLETRSKRIFKN